MLDNILKSQHLNLMFGWIVFTLVSFTALYAASNLQSSNIGILFVGFALGIASEKWNRWLDKKQEELNS